MADRIETARAFLAGRRLSFADANALWRDLKTADEISLARRVLERMRGDDALADDPGLDLATARRLSQQEALLTSKDLELSASVRHDRALKILAKGVGRLDDPVLDGDVETLGIAGGILKRRWSDLGQIEDLRRAARFYERGAKAADLGDDAYTHINAAFIDDLLASLGDDQAARAGRAAALRMRILSELKPSDSWFNAATRAEALFGLGRFGEAAKVIAASRSRPAPWELETTARQLGLLAHVRVPHPLDVPEIRAFFEALLPGAADAARSVVIGKVGLALSGGGFRASFYHLGVLARLAELDVLRHVEVLSCVSGGSIVGACYWLVLRQQLKTKGRLTRDDYVGVVRTVIDHFIGAVSEDLRGRVQPRWLRVATRLLSGEKGVLDPELSARGLDEIFYRPLFDPNRTTPIYMRELPFRPADHDAALTGSKDFNPGRHNWLRADKVPVLVLNATTVNTGHAWQFTPTWMGESPWAIHEAADSIQRLEWSWYVPGENWDIELGRAVAASACVPGVFAPLRITAGYDDLDVHLVDGGVYDNQGTVSVLAQNCNVVLVSDACGQLLLDKRPQLANLLSYANRSMSTLMERVRLASYADLDARRRSGLLRGLMFLHMKAGLDADSIRLRFSQESYQLTREKLSPSGVRKDLQQTLAELRTDLDAFTDDESAGLMACGYQMATFAFEQNLGAMTELWRGGDPVEWRFTPMLKEITSTEPSTARRSELLTAFAAGSAVRLKT